jgi:hypothetical protein
LWKEKKPHVSLSLPGGAPPPPPPAPTRLGDEWLLYAYSHNFLCRQVYMMRDSFHHVSLALWMTPSDTPYVSWCMACWNSETCHHHVSGWEWSYFRIQYNLAVNYQCLSTMMVAACSVMVEAKMPDLCDWITRRTTPWVGNLDESSSRADPNGLNHAWSSQYWVSRVDAIPEGTRYRTSCV